MFEHTCTECGWTGDQPPEINGDGHHINPTGGSCNAAITATPMCPRCEGDGSYSKLADCTTLDKGCACNFERVTVDPCEVCGGSGASRETLAPKETTE